MTFQIAIAKFFDGETTDPVAEARASLENMPPPNRATHREMLLNGSSSFSSHSSSGHRDIDPAPRVVPQPESQVTRRPPFFITLLLTPFNIVYRVILSSLGFFAYLFPFLPRLLSARASGLHTRSSSARNTTGRRSLGPRDAAARFAREFEEEYGSNPLSFYENGYAQALDSAKNDLKFLLVLLLSPEHDDTSTFIRHTLLAPEVVDYVNDPQNNMIVWAGGVQDSEAYQVSTALNCTKFPFAALITLTPGTSSTAMSVVARITGPTPPGAFVAKVRDAVSEHAGALDGIRATRAARQSERNLREEQNSAYERSLAQDRERARKRRQAEEAKAKAEREARQRAEKEARDAERRLLWKRWRVQSLSPEPTADVKNASRVSIRMPSGERIVRKFAFDVPMEELYAFVECYDMIQAEQHTVPAKAEKSPGFDHQYGFQLVSPMPRTVYELAAGGSVGERIGRSGNLIVEPLDGDDEEEDEV